MARFQASGRLPGASFRRTPDFRGGPRGGIQASRGGPRGGIQASQRCPEVIRSPRRGKPATTRVPVEPRTAAGRLTGRLGRTGGRLDSGRARWRGGVPGVYYPSLVYPALVPPSYPALLYLPCTHAVMLCGLVWRWQPGPGYRLRAWSFWCINIPGRRCGKRARVARTLCF